MADMLLHMVTIYKHVFFCFFCHFYRELCWCTISRMRNHLTTSETGSGTLRRWETYLMLEKISMKFLFNFVSVSYGFTSVCFISMHHRMWNGWYWVINVIWMIRDKFQKKEGKRYVLIFFFKWLELLKIYL